MASFPPLRVEFDDGTTLDLEPKGRDLAFAERDFHHDYTESGSFRSVYATALATLGRLKRAGKFDGDLPESIDAFMEIADVESITDDADPEGKDSGQAQPTG